MPLLVFVDDDESERVTMQRIATNLARRSKLGDDALNNLITLCVICHQGQHHFPTSAHNGFS